MERLLSEASHHRPTASQIITLSDGLIRRPGMGTVLGIR
jgi:hypothetical protein